MILSPVFPRQSSKPIDSALRTPRFEASHPEWLVSLIQEIEQYQRAVQECAVIRNASGGLFTRAQAQECLIQFYPFMATFPQWISLNLMKTSDCAIQDILKRYVSRTTWQAQQWVLMAEGFGVCRKKLFETPIRIKIAALNQYMWTVNRHQSLAEGVMTMGYAIGGVMKMIAPLLLDGFRQYAQYTNEVLQKNTVAWVLNHVQYDNRVVFESLEITKGLVSKESEQDAVRTTSLQSLQFLLTALEDCGVEYDPCDSFRHAHHVAA